MKKSDDKFIMYGYTKKTIKFFVSRPAAGAFLDPGLGKTMISYLSFEILKDLKYIKKLVVVTLLRPAYKVWPMEIKKWGLPFTCVVLHGSKKNVLLQEKADVYIINYDGLPWLMDNIESKNVPWLKDCMLVFDESSKLRNTNTQRFRIVKKFIGYFKRRYILTGSPTPKGLMNLFGQIYVLDGGVRLTKFITHFRNKYFNKSQLGSDGPFVYSIKEGADKKIYQAISDVVIRFGEEELDMPKLVYNKVVVELPPAARTVYNDLERDLIAAIDEHIVVAKNAGIASQKLRQVANGGLYIQAEQRTWKKLHDEKTDAVLELIDGLEGKPALVGYEFHHDRERLSSALPKNTPWIGGDVNMKRAGEIIDDWNAGNVEVLMGQISALAHGNNLQSGPCRDIIFHSFVWDYEAYDQFIRRIYRQGQKAKRVRVHHIVAENTVDEVVLESMQTKGAAQNALFQALKEYAKTRTVITIKQSKKVLNKRGK